MQEKVLRIILGILLVVFVAMIAYLYFPKHGWQSGKDMPKALIEKQHKITLFSDIPKADIAIDEEEIRNYLDDLGFWNKGAILYRTLLSENQIISIDVEDQKVDVDRLEIFLTTKEQPFMKRFKSEKVEVETIYSSFGTKYSTNGGGLQVYIQVHPDTINDYSPEEAITIISRDLASTFWQLTHSELDYNGKQRLEEMNKYVNSQLISKKLKLVKISL